MGDITSLDLFTISVTVLSLVLFVSVIETNLKLISNHFKT